MKGTTTAKRAKVTALAKAMKAEQTRSTPLAQAVTMRPSELNQAAWSLVPGVKAKRIRLRLRASKPVVSMLKAAPYTAGEQTLIKREDRT